MLKSGLDKTPKLSQLNKIYYLNENNKKKYDYHSKGDSYRNTIFKVSVKENMCPRQLKLCNRSFNCSFIFTYLKKFLIDF